MRTLAALLVLFAALASATAAHAQLDEGRRQLAQADFARAIRAFDRAERGAHLAHDDLVAIYEGRAMARCAVAVWLGRPPVGDVDLHIDLDGELPGLGWRHVDRAQVDPHRIPTRYAWIMERGTTIEVVLPGTMHTTCVSSVAKPEGNRSRLRQHASLE